MAAEKGGVGQVEDEPGKGFFQVTIEEGGQETIKRVPVIKGWKAIRAYKEQQIGAGAPVIAYRTGRNCVVSVNVGAMEVESAEEFGLFHEWGLGLRENVWKWRRLNRMDWLGDRLVRSYGEGVYTPKIEFRGESMRTWSPIEITVGFVR